MAPAPGALSRSAAAGDAIASDNRIIWVDPTTVGLDSVSMAEGGSGGRHHLGAPLAVEALELAGCAEHLVTNQRHRAPFRPASKEAVLASALRDAATQEFETPSYRRREEGVKSDNSTDASVEVTTGSQSAHGPYRVSPHYATYSYCRFPDDSFTARAMDRRGR